MYTTRIKKEKKSHPKKDKLSKLINNSDSEEGDIEHELSYYVNDRVKLMKEVLKIIKPKKIRSMAPTCMKNLDNEEINSMLLEELLGISNKRLKYIFSGQNLDEDSSSTDPEDDQNPVDVISLDDISDDDFVIDLNSDTESRRRRCKKHRLKIKEEPTKEKKVKKEKHDKDYPQQKLKELVHDTSEQNLMSVLELLELQARARAIRSQLVLENNRKAQENKRSVNTEKNEKSDDDIDIIVESPKNEEIVITSSESENEYAKKEIHIEHQSTNSQNEDSNENKNPEKSKEKNIVQQVNMIENSKEADDRDKTNGKDQIETIPVPNNEEKNSNEPEELPKIQRKCRRKHRTKCNRSSSNIDNPNTEKSKEFNTEIGANTTNADENNELSVTKDSITDDKLVKDTQVIASKQKVKKQDKSSIDEGDGIVLNVDQSEMECIYLD